MYNLFKAVSFILIFSIYNLGLAQTFTEIEAKLKISDYSEAHKELLPLIKKGDANAQNLLGELYFGIVEADDFEQKLNMAEAEKWFKLAAEQNLAKAQINLGNLYKNIADHIYMLSLWQMPVDYEISEENKQDLADINTMWCKLAIEHGNTEVEYDTNMLGKYRPKADNEIYKEALKWFKKSADQNDVDGQYNLCHLYAGGLGVKKDFEEATKWCQLAEKQNYSKAKDMLQYIKETQKLCSDKDKVEEYKNQHPFFIKPDC